MLEIEIPPYNKITLTYQHDTPRLLSGLPTQSKLAGLRFSKTKEYIKWGLGECQAESAIGYMTDSVLNP